MTPGPRRPGALPGAGPPACPDDPDAGDPGVRCSGQRHAPDEHGPATADGSRPRASRRGRRRVGVRCAARSPTPRPAGRRRRRPPAARAGPGSPTRRPSRCRPARVARRWRSPRAAPRAAASPRAGDTAVSTGPEVRTTGVNPSTGTYSLTSRRTPARSESPRRSCSSKMVPRIARMVSSRSPTAASSRSLTLPSAGHRRDPLQLQAGGEEPLDDDVVQVARDALAVGDQRQLLAVGERLRAVEGERDLVGEAGEELAVLHVDEPRAGLRHRDQRRHRREVGAQGHDDHGDPVDVSHVHRTVRRGDRSPPARARAPRSSRRRRRPGPRSPCRGQGPAPTTAPPLVPATPAGRSRRSAAARRAGRPVAGAAPASSEEASSHWRRCSLRAKDRALLIT